MNLIDVGTENLEKKESRGYLGASIIGEQCNRKKWFIFRNAVDVEINPRVLRIFRLGHILEDEVIKLLMGSKKAVVNNLNEEGKQYGFSDIHGHFKGHCDGIIETDDFFGILEVKSSNLKSFERLKKNGVAIEKFTHYIQMQVYMGQMKYDKALYVVYCKDNSEIYSEIVKFSESSYQFAMETANDIIKGKTPPRPYSENQSKLCCTMCDYKAICKGAVPAKKSCKMCKYSRPAKDGKWGCRKDNSIIEKVDSPCSNFEQIPIHEYK